MLVRKTVYRNRQYTAGDLLKHYLTLSFNNISSSRRRLVEDECNKFTNFKCSVKICALMKFII